MLIGSDLFENLKLYGLKHMMEYLEGTISASVTRVASSDRARYPKGGRRLYREISDRTRTITRRDAPPKRILSDK